MTSELILLFFLICGVAALVHGSVGFGFPMLSTPLLAMVTDVPTAIMTTIIPNIFINIVSIVSEGMFWQAVKRHYQLIAYTALDSAFGTVILIYFESDVFKLLLAFAIFAYLLLLIGINHGRTKFKGALDSRIAQIL